MAQQAARWLAAGGFAELDARGVQAGRRLRAEQLPDAGDRLLAAGDRQQGRPQPWLPPAVQRQGGEGRPAGRRRRPPCRRHGQGPDQLRRRPSPARPPAGRRNRHQRLQVDPALAALLRRRRPERAWLRLPDAVAGEFRWRQDRRPLHDRRQRRVSISAGRALAPGDLRRPGQRLQLAGLPSIKTGVGFGVRWVSPVGPLRLDLAHALDDDGGFRLHFSMGPEL